MRPEFRRALEAAAQHDRPSGRIAVIKNAVKDEVSAVDPSVRVRFTDYFNHSVAPDLVLEWPHEDRKRPLFVRSASAAWLLNDMRLIASHHPVIFTLEDLGTESAATPRKSLQAAAATAGTWVTDSTGTEAIADVRARSPILGMLGQALVRGGRGVADAPEVRKLVNATQRGFAGAAKGAERPARSAVKAIEGHLDRDQAGRLTRLLRAVWEGHGADGASFPTTASLGTLTADDLSYLLSIPSDGSPDFWTKIGRAVSTELLASVRVDDPSPNLQALVSASLDRLEAKGVRLIDEPYELFEPDDYPRWIVTRNRLALRGQNWTAYLAARRTEEFPPTEDAELPDYPTITSRATANRTRISQVQIEGHDTAVTVESRQGEEVLGRDELNAIVERMGNAPLREAVAVLPDGRNVKVDFPQRTASGSGSVTFLLRPLLLFVLPLLSDFSAYELAGIQRVVRGGDSYEDLYPELPGYGIEN